MDLQLWSRKVGPMAWSTSSRCICHPKLTAWFARILASSNQSALIWRAGVCLPSCCIKSARFKEFNPKDHRWSWKKSINTNGWVIEWSKRTLRALYFSSLCQYWDECCESVVLASEDCPVQHVWLGEKQHSWQVHGMWAKDKQDHQECVEICASVYVSFLLCQGRLNDDDNFKGFTHKLHRTSRTYKNVFYSVKLFRVGGGRQRCVRKVVTQWSFNGWRRWIASPFSMIGLWELIWFNNELQDESIP